MADLLVIVPSRGRPESVARMVDAWTETGAYGHANLLFAIDLDDPQHDAYQAQASDRALMLTLDRWLPMVHKLDKAAHGYASPIFDYFALAFFGDDHLPRTPGWAKRYLDELHVLGTGIVYGNDLLQGEKLPTQWAMTSDIVRALGRMVPAPVEHLCSDSSVYDLGQQASCIRYLPDVVIEHMHPAAGKASEDDGYRRVNSAEQVQCDSRTYRHWRATQLDHDAATVRALRERQPA
ncbi:hypothetical protein ABZ814_13445 [Micromonospora musae]|uniref:hypothetical protein n=1 Tax=Micromonospora musae TaxID=1894970 RepID=UPI0033FDD9AF